MRRINLTEIVVSKMNKKMKKELTEMAEACDMSKSALIRLLIVEKHKCIFGECKL